MYMRVEQRTNNERGFKKKLLYFSIYISIYKQSIMKKLSKSKSEYEI